MQRQKVLITGSIAFDDIKTHKARARGVTGGSASYASIAASYWAEAKVIGIVGIDFGAKRRAPFERRGVDLSGLEVKKGKTFTWAASYDKDFKNATTLSTKLNVFAGFNPVLSAQDRKARAVFLANIAPSLQLSTLEQLEKPALVACDTMNLWINNNRAELKKLLKKTDILFVNEAEARQLTGIYNLIKAGRAILAAGPRIAIIKLGPNGSVVVSKDCLCQLPPVLVEDPADTTGAGDSFGGGFTGYLASVKDWKDIKNIKRAMAVGTVMASFAIESFSIDRLASLTKGQIDTRLKKYIEAIKI